MRVFQRDRGGAGKLKFVAWALVAVTAVLIVSMCSTSCSSTPARQAFIGVDAATDVVNGINDAAKLSPAFKAKLPAIAPYVDAVKKAQDSLDTAITAKSVTLDAYQQALTDAVASLLNQKAAVTRSLPPPPATLPATP